MRQVTEQNHFSIIPVFLTGSDNLYIWEKPEDRNIPENKYSIFQKTILHLKRISHSPIIYTCISPTHLKDAKEQILEIEMESSIQIMIEPLDRGSQNTLAVCALDIEKSHDDALIMCIDAAHLPRDWDLLEANYQDVISSPVSQQMIIACGQSHGQTVKSAPNHIKRTYTARFPIVFTITNTKIADNDVFELGSVTFTMASTLIRALEDTQNQVLEACKRSLLYADSIQGLIWPNHTRWTLIPNRCFSEFLHGTKTYVLNHPFTAQQPVSAQNKRPYHENNPCITGSMVEIVNKCIHDTSQEHSFPYPS